VVQRLRLVWDSSCRSWFEGDGGGEALNVDIGHGANEAAIELDSLSVYPTSPEEVGGST
jgi:hypothetical protein